MNIKEALLASKQALRALRMSSIETRNNVLNALAAELLNEQAEILHANSLDINQLKPDVAPSFRDRLLLTPARLEGMRESLKQVASLPDPLNEVVEKRILKNGLEANRVRTPLGLIFMIFESRPNVAIEAFSLALKSGNGIILRGGKESVYTVSLFYQLIQKALSAQSLPQTCLLGITDPDRSIVLDLLQQKKWIDVVVPRGGDALIDFVVENSKIPIIKNDRGLCHLYVHEDANLTQALTIIENAKKQRPGVCNSMETLLVHQSIASNFLPEIHELLSQKPNPVEWFGCEKTIAILKPRAYVKPATECNFNTEYLDYKMNCKVVASLEEALEHIEKFGSKHSEAILTQNPDTAKRFQNEVDAAAVYSNASTRFTDGFELGLGGELGISTQKLHVRGPVGLKELTSIRWVISGDGQIRD